MTTPELDAIQNTTRQILGGLIESGQKVALVDFPNHVNAGDSLIFLGEMSYLGQLGVEVEYLVDKERYDPETLRRRLPVGPILLHGGGNFGDRWERFQEFRERVISDFPDRQIIQLPQGIEFSDGPRLRRAQAVFGAHRDLTLLIRDSVGVTRAKELFPTTSVVYCPDMAFGNGPIAPMGEPEVAVVVLQRDDSESVSDPYLPSDSRSSIVVDWGLSWSERLVETVLRVPGMTVKRLPMLAVTLHPVLMAAFIRLARLRTRSAVKILSKGELIVTDRLHATVYAALLGKTVIALPNANGKIKAIVDDYLGTLPGVTFMQNADDASRGVERAFVDLKS